MNLIFELILLCILVGSSYAGIKFGFIQIAAKPIKIIASLAFAFSLCKSVGTVIIAPIIQNPVSAYIKEFVYAKCSNLTSVNAYDELPTLLKMAGAAFNVDMNAQNAVSQETVLDNAILNLTSPAVNLIGIAVAFVLLLIVGRILMSLGVYLVNSFCRSGLIAKVNKAMGFVLAGMMSLIGAWAFVSVVEFLFHLPMFENSAAVQGFSGGFLYRLFISVSPLELLLSF